MGRKKNKPSDNATPATATPTEPNRSQLVREALDSGISSPKEIVDSIKTKHNVEVKAGLVSIVKGKWKADKGGKAKAKGKPGRKSKVAASAATGNGHVAVGGVSIDDLVALKGLVAKHGVKGVGRLLEVIA